MDARLVSRKPAAIVGITMVLLLGLSFFGGLQTLTGQLTGSNVVVHITESGMVPASIHVEQGTTVQWINDHSDPQILESRDLCNDAGECLFTPTIFPGDNVEFTVTKDIAAGNYTYGSVTHTELMGQVTVETAQSAPSGIGSMEHTVLDELARVAEEVVADDLPAQRTAAVLPSTQPTMAQENVEVPTAETAPVPTQNVQKQSIPTNTNTVAGRTAHTGAPSEVPLAQQGYKPFTQPQTGPSTWVAAVLLLVSISILTWRTRRTVA